MCSPRFSRYRPPFNEPKPQPIRGRTDVTDTRSTVCQRLEIGLAPDTSHQPLSEPEEPNLGIPIKICAALCVFAPIIHVLSLEYLQFRAFEPATWHAV